jgi:hypothetical protein
MQGIARAAIVACIRSHEQASDHVHGTGQSFQNVTSQLVGAQQESGCRFPLCRICACGPAAAQCAIMCGARDASLMLAALHVFNRCRACYSRRNIDYMRGRIHVRVVDHLFIYRCITIHMLQRCCTKRVATLLSIATLQLSACAPHRNCNVAIKITHML